MTHSALARVIALGLAAVALPVLAQEAPSASGAEAAVPASDGPDAQDIYVYGRSGTGIVVDVERIAVSCVACRRALDALREDGGSSRRRASPGQLNSVAEDNSLIGVGGGPLSNYRVSRTINTHSGIGGASSIGSMQRRAWAGRQRQQQRGSAAYRSVGSAYLQNLMRYLAPIIERHRAARQVETVYRPDQAPRRRNFPDVTDEILQEFDREHSAVDLLSPA